MSPVALRNATPTEGRKFAPTLKDARMGDVDAQYHLGLMYANGAGVKKDLTQALEWITRSAERGHAGAQFLLGRHLAGDAGVGVTRQADDARALEWLMRAGQQGHARAWHRLAQLISQESGSLATAFEARAASQGLAEAQLALGLGALDAAAAAPQGSGAIVWLQRAAEQGLAAAQCALGRLLAEGRHAAQDLTAAKRWLRLAAEQGWPSALVWLDFLDGDGAAGTLAHTRGRPRQPSSTVHPSIGEADPDDAEARYHLGLLHELGLLGQPDIWKARHWYGLAAQQGLPAALTALGRLDEASDELASLAAYRRAAQAGDGQAQAALARLLLREDRSPAERLEGLQAAVQAARQGQADALLMLADQLQSTQPDLASDCLRQAAEAGLPEAQLRMGRAAARRGQAADQADAVRWYEFAAQQGLASAQVALADACRHGRGTARDEAAAARWLESAVAAGDACACWHLALLLAAGSPSLPRDLERARDLCRTAADSGFAPAQSTLGILLASLQQHADAVPWWRLAAEQGDAEAQYNLGLALDEGRGIPADPEGAFGWWLAAAEQGLAPAMARVGLAYATGRGVAVDPIEAHKWFVLARQAGDASAAQNLLRSQQLLSADARAEAERRAAKRP
jgi:uncharacterized protein